MHKSDYFGVASWTRTADPLFPMLTKYYAVIGVKWKEPCPSYFREVCGIGLHCMLVLLTIAQGNALSHVYENSRYGQDKRFIHPLNITKVLIVNT